MLPWFKYFSEPGHFGCFGGRGGPLGRLELRWGLPEQSQGVGGVLVSAEILELLLPLHLQRWEHSLVPQAALDSSPLRSRSEQ